MIKRETPLFGVYVVEPKVFGDERGWFYESYSKASFDEIGITDTFVQDNRSYSARKGTLRGLHCQKLPFSQAKLVSCTHGEILDVAVDVRPDSPTYMRHYSIILSAQNKRMLYIPKGCLHGFVTLTDDVELYYKVNAFYNPQNDRSVLYSDPALGIEWGAGEFILSEKDKNAPLLKDSDIY